MEEKEKERRERKAKAWNKISFEDIPQVQLPKDSYNSKKIKRSNIRGPSSLCESLGRTFPIHPNHYSWKALPLQQRETQTQQEVTPFSSTGKMETHSDCRKRRTLISFQPFGNLPEECKNSKVALLPPFSIFVLVFTMAHVTNLASKFLYIWICSNIPF